MLDTRGVPAGRQHLHLQSTAALGAEAGRLKRTGPPAFRVIGVGECLAAPIAPGLSVHSVADSAFTGIDSSARRSRSWLAGRPNVVR